MSMVRSVLRHWMHCSHTDVSLPPILRESAPTLHFFEAYSTFTHVRPADSPSRPRRPSALKKLFRSHRYLCLRSRITTGRSDPVAGQDSHLQDSTHLSTTHQNLWVDKTAEPPGLCPRPRDFQGIAAMSNELFEKASEPRILGSDVTRHWRIADRAIPEQVASQQCLPAFHSALFSGSSS